MKLLKSLIISLALSAQVFAICEAQVKDCEDLLRVTEEELAQYKELAKRQEDYNTILKKQRDEAYNQLEDSYLSSTPWYFWVLIGGAATTILIKGIK